MDYQAIWKYVKDWLFYLLRLFTNLFKTKKKLQHENIILYLQLALFIHEVETGKRPKPKITPAFRQIMVLHAKRYSDWKSIIKVCQPATVIGWFNNKFSLYWFKKSKKGRPSISPKTIALIKRIHRDNPLFSPEKIHDQLVLLNVTDAPAPNTIAKYLPSTGKPPSEKQIQSWLTFLRNHAPDTWGMDFLTVPTLFFKVLYVLVIINHGTRKIEHFAVTANPNVFWLVQQLRNATPYDHKPKYLIHDNDAVFTSSVFKNFLAGSGIKSKKTAIKAPWQNPYAERVIGTLRRELLDYMIPVNERHLEYLLGEYVHKYYNTHRTHQGIDGRTPIPSPEYPPTTMEETKLKATPVLGGLYHTYEKKGGLVGWSVWPINGYPFFLTANMVVYLCCRFWVLPIFLQIPRPNCWSFFMDAIYFLLHYLLILTAHFPRIDFLKATRVSTRAANLQKVTPQVSRPPLSHLTSK